jgi:hypothetical protein
VPLSQKVAVIAPCLKKVDLDPNAMSSYRPVSNLSFLSKVIEHAVYNQLMAYLNAANLLRPRQSAYRAGFSMETALL